MLNPVTRFNGNLDRIYKCILDGSTAIIPECFCRLYTFFFLWAVKCQTNYLILFPECFSGEKSLLQTWKQTRGCESRTQVKSNILIPNRRLKTKHLSIDYLTCLICCSSINNLQRFDTCRLSVTIMETFPYCWKPVVEPERFTHSWIFFS